MQILNQIQQKLKVPKQSNKAVAYKSRSAEDIIEMVKPLLGEAILTISDELVLVGERYYVKATATITHISESMSATAYAREDETPKFMSVAQGTGSTSSYARKYALNGLLLIDDTQDDDTRQYDGEMVREAKKIVLDKLLETPKTLTVYEQAEKAINQVNTLTELSKLVENMNKSTKLSTKEKEDLNTQASFKSQELT